jgi:glycosyltransferase involved in cell wall biosynthesis
MKLLSIVVPVYNSAETLEELYARIAGALAGKQVFELLLVDDGSRDNSWATICRLKEKAGEQLKGIRLSRNCGQHHAIVCGFGYAQGNAILTMDDDLQHPPEEIIKLVEKFDSDDADVVYGIYSDKQHSAARNAGSSFVQQSSKMVAGNTGQGSSFRMIRKKTAEQIYTHRHQQHLFIDEVLHWYTTRFAVVSVEHHERKKGRSGYTFSKLAGMYFDILINYTAIPLKLMTWGGLLASIFTFLLGLRFIYLKLVHGSKPGFTATIVAILFSTSLLMFCMGILGQYMYKLYQQQNRRPQFSVDTVI